MIPKLLYISHNQIDTATTDLSLFPVLQKTITLDIDVALWKHQTDTKTLLGKAAASGSTLDQEKIQITKKNYFAWHV